MIKNAFYFTSKSLFVLKMFKNSFVRKVRLISKFMTSQPGKQTIALHTLPNISRRKYNQTMKYGQLVEYNMRNI